LVIHNKQHRELGFPLWTSNQEFQEKQSEETSLSKMEAPITQFQEAST
jgi:hypothetical protein